MAMNAIARSSNGLDYLHPIKLGTPIVTPQSCMRQAAGLRPDYRLLVNYYPSSNSEVIDVSHGFSTGMSASVHEWGLDPLGR